MTCTIRILDEKTINQIAAGEVIENPASVIKELVDNAIDAKASKILIIATNSGRQTIRVQDNGCGMSHDDAILSIERHATSKIRTVDDLYSISSMGFRGEALSSIASVSEMRLLTALNNGTEELIPGTCVQVHGGKILSANKVECLGGTDIEVRSLFYNVPARRKFLKSPAKDANDIHKIVLQLALAHPQVGFELVVNQEKVLSLQPQSTEERIKQAQGSEFFSQLIAVHHQSDQVVISGYIGKPEYSRPTRVSQYLFVNQRPVSSLMISSCVKEAYGTTLDSTRHPAYVLYVTLAQDLLDVNVHPQKREVRFSGEEELKKAVMAAISGALFSHPVATPKVSQEFTFAAPAREFQQTIRPYPLEVIAEPSLIPVKPQFQVQGVFKEYILADIDWADKKVPEDLAAGGLYVISANRALSRIAFDGAEHGKEVAKGVTQMLLVPLFLELTPVEATRLKGLLTPLGQAGLSIREFGVSSFLVEAIPSYLEEVDVEEAIREMVSDDNEVKVAETFAEIAAESKGRLVLTREIAEQITKKLLASVDPFVSPFGARIVSLISHVELEKKFR